jgi:UDP-2-acetamido-3-amino-2,3-dideoxy-glucuronate N-acetyltransferase
MKESVPAVAIIGAGYWGKNLVRNFYELGALRAICDKDPASLARFDDSYPDVPKHLHMDPILQDPGIHAVAVVTPAATHYTMAREALLAGKDVFVEKPLCLEEHQAAELVALAAERDRVLMVGHLLRYHPALVRLLELVDAGELGRVYYIYSNRLNLGKIRQEENILWSFAPHDISVILTLAGERPQTVVCRGGNYLNDSIADVTISMLEFSSGLRAHIFVSWLHPYKDQRLIVVGDRKMAVFDDMAPLEEKLLLYPHQIEWRNHIPTPKKGTAMSVDIEPTEPLRLECQHFLSCVNSRAKPLTDGDEGWQVLRVLKACQHSLERGQPVLLNGTDGSLEPYYSHSTVVVDQPCEIGPATKIWHFSHIMAGARIGKNCVLGQNVHVAPGVIIGDNVKIQNNVSLYTGVEIETGVFCGPSCVFTNVTNPRSEINRHDVYERTLVRRGATIGANATIVCGSTIGRYAFIGAGAVVRGNVPDYALMVGVPALQKGWMSRHGHRLQNPDRDGVMICPEAGWRYREVEPGVLRCLDCLEDEPFPGPAMLPPIRLELVEVAPLQST